MSQEVTLYGKDGEPVKLHLVGHQCKGYVDEGMIGFVDKETGEHQTLALMKEQGGSGG